MHILDDVQLGDAGMCDFQIPQHFRDYAMNPAALDEHGVGDNAHQAETAATIDQINAARCHGLAE